MEQQVMQGQGMNSTRHGQEVALAHKRRVHAQARCNVLNDMLRQHGCLRAHTHIHPCEGVCTATPHMQGVPASRHGAKVMPLATRSRQCRGDKHQRGLVRRMHARGARLGT